MLSDVCSACAVALLWASPAHAAGGNTKTQTLTVSLTESVTGTQSPSVSLTESVTGTTSHSLSQTQSVTLTQSLSSSLTQTQSVSETETSSASLTLSSSESRTGTESVSDSITLSLLAHTNYTAEIEPQPFYEGQEFRLRLTTGLSDNAWLFPKEGFNISDLTSVQVRLYKYSATYGRSCPDYITSGTLLDSRDQFGLSASAQSSGRRFTQHAYVTFPAPSAANEFVICFKHRFDPPTEYNGPAALNDVWQSAGAEEASAVFRALPSETFYHLPDATAGQYAIVQLLNYDLGWNFTYPSSLCATQTTTSNVATECCRGDNLKVVPQGQPCSYEYQSYSYPFYGTAHCHANGHWHPDAKPGLHEGSVAGGLGAFGTQFANPMVDSWSSYGRYPDSQSPQRTGPTGIVQPPTATRPIGHAYAYIRVPTSIASSFDVCYSGVELRSEMVSTNATAFEAPLWRKLVRCAAADAEAGNCASSIHTAATFSFTVVSEPLGWSMIELTERTWGDIVFDDNGESQLNALPMSTLFVASSPTTAGHPQAKTTTVNYWSPSGGDYYKLVPSSQFTEYTSAARGGDYGHTTGGSFPSAGCWSTAYDLPATTWHLGGYVELGDSYPIGAHDLSTDPTVAASRATLPESGANATFSSVFLPTKGSSWYVCYRRTCTFTGASCAKHSGMRVLAFHKASRGKPPTHWLHLEDNYTPGVESTSAHLLVPGAYTPPLSYVKFPCPAIWSMNDTRQNTYGPFVVEKNDTADATTAELDSRAWNFRSMAANVSVAISTQGSTLRLVPAHRSCVDPQFFELGHKNPVSLDGGKIECNSQGAEQKDLTDSSWDCEGSASDIGNTTKVAYYIQVPPSGTYRVCHRLRGWNWRELEGVYVPGDDALSKLSIVEYEERAGMEALFLISDTDFTLTAGPRLTCAAASKETTFFGSLDCPLYTSHDVLRLVPDVPGACDINPSNWNAALADTHLSLYCPVSGHDLPERSGLWRIPGLAESSAPCSHSAPVLSLCGGACNSSTGPLAAFALKTPEMYDDIVPGNAEYVGLGHVAASVTLPAFSSVPANNRYRVCYKQSASPNWVVFNETWVIQPPLTLKVVAPPLNQRVLLSGELQKYTIDYPEVLPLNASDTTGKTPAVVAFYAKLVRKQPSSPRNNNCVAPAGSTEGELYSASTRVVFMDPIRTATHDANGNPLPPQTWTRLHFHLVTPHDAGDYFLCVQLKQHLPDSMSWWRAGDTSYRVVDNGLRWFVHPGYQPMNSGLTRVNLLRCLVVGTAACDPTKTLETFEISPNKDSAKIVPSTMACTASGLDYRVWQGNSTHVGVGASVHGVRDLGPADGISDVAEMTLTMPLPNPNVETPYKVCAHTKFLGSYLNGQHHENRRWVEVRQAVGRPVQLAVTDRIGNKAFVTQKAVAVSWTLDSPLRPAKSLITRTGGFSNIGLAGASTQYLSNPTSARSTEPPQERAGFSFQASEAVSNAQRYGNIFKLVAAKLPQMKEPPVKGNITEWGDVAGWQTKLQVDCSASAVVSNIETCHEYGDVLCPKVLNETDRLTHIPAVFHLPMDPGEYYVCYKAQNQFSGVEQPWHWVKGTGGSYGLVVHPTYLEFAVTANKTNLTAYDTRVVLNATTGSLSPVSSWCATETETADEGVPCTTQNFGGFKYDLLRVVNSSQLCPLPLSTPYGQATTPADGTGWYQLTRLNNVSVVIAPTASGAPQFVLPPRYPSPTGAFKVCVYKAGEATERYFSELYQEYVSRKGVVYQVVNRGLDGAAGSNTGFWVDNSPTQLVVQTDLVFDKTIQFMQYETGLEAAYAATNAALITDVVTSYRSHTPLLRSGTTVHYDVTVASESGQTLQIGSYPIEVLRCKASTSWTVGLRCDSNNAPVDSGDFLIENINGACRDKVAESYGWPVSGLRQFMNQGRIRMSLQYVSACPVNHFGCGIKFSARRSLTAYIDSPAQWVNINPHAPDSVSIGKQETNPAATPVARLSPEGCAETNSPDCVMQVCTHEELCTLRIQARYQGPTEFAPTGFVLLSYSQYDYADSAVSSDGVPVQVTTSFGKTIGKLATQLAPWKTGGYYEHTFTPTVETGTHGYVYFNVSFGGFGTTGLWTRFVLKVTKTFPTKFQFTSARPLDAFRGLHQVSPVRTPAPAFYSEKRGNALHAQKGSHLEALIPYELSYQPFDSSDVQMPQARGAMHGWEIQAVVEGSPESAVLMVPAGTDTYSSIPSILEQQVLRLQPTTDDVFFSIPFRVFVADNACSRFNAAGGCTLAFTFQHLTLQYSVRSTLVTPVRIPASTVEVTTSENTQTGLYFSVSEGIVATVRPGTYVVSMQNTERFVYDDFHYGDAFALISGPAPADGITNRDLLRMTKDVSSSALVSDICAYEVSPGNCTVWRYSTQYLSDVNGWGARWTLRPDKPCYRCQFTFHTSWGAGPQSHVALGEGAEQRGTKTLTWQADDIELVCSNALVTFLEKEPRSDVFSVTVTAGVRGTLGRTAGYPRWWVFSDTKSDLEHYKTGYPDQLGQLYSVHQKQTGVDWFNGTETPQTTTLLRGKMGAGAEVTLSNLYMFGTKTPLSGFPEVFRLAFHSVAVTYRMSVGAPAGTVPAGQQQYSCNAVLTMNRWYFQQPPIQIRPVSIEGANPLCEAAENCLEWFTTVDILAANGITLTVLFTNPTDDGGFVVDTSPDRNATIVPQGGARSSPFFAAPVWTFDEPSQSYVSEGMKLDSSHNKVILDKRDGFVYTYGTLDVVARRPSIVNVFPPDGMRSISFTYGANSGQYEQNPVREAMFSICDSKWSFTGDFEATGASCVQLKLWVIPEQYTPELALWSQPNGGRNILGPGTGCGPSPTKLELTVVPYYVPHSLSTSAKLRYYVYDNTVSATVSLEGGAQYFVPENGRVAYRSLSASNSVVVSENKTVTLKASVAAADLRITFAFYGRDEVPATDGGKKLVVASKMFAGFSGTLDMQNITTTNKYHWIGAASVETYGGWEVSDKGVTVDEECPSQRLMHSWTHGYLTYSAGPPGELWDYSRPNSAHAGVPFPIQTVVKTQTNARAWSFQTGTLVKTTKRSWVGCNDGGTMKAYYLRASESEQTATLRGNLASFVEGFGVTNSSVPSKQGVAVVWPLFETQCELCTLQFDLCYTGRTDVDCMEAGSSAVPSDLLPLLPERSKISKPFSVRDPAPDSLQIYEQNVPASGSKLFTGELLKIKAINVLLYARGGEKTWAMDDVVGSRWRRKVYARAQWVPTVTDGYEPSSLMKYGYGGFMFDASTRPPRQACDAAVSTAEFGASTTYQSLLTEAVNGELSFFFTRPCSNCEVYIDYTFERIVGDLDAVVLQVLTRTGSFPLRSYANIGPSNPAPSVGSVLRYAVVTCGIKWIGAGAPPTAVRKRKPFALGVIHVDANNLPSYDMQPIVNASVPVPAGTGAGNGAGGTLTLTTPTDRRVGAADGTYLYRMHYTRACYICTVSLAYKGYSVDYLHTVLTDATQIVVVPAFSIGRDSVQWFRDAGTKGTWTFELYAADDAGDRSYTVGGPTHSAFQPVYSSHNIGGGSRVAAALSLAGSTAESVTFAATLQDEVHTLSTLSYGKPNVQITSGTLIHNGIPVPSLAGEEGRVGSTVVTISDSPGISVPLEFSINTLPPGAAVSYYGEKRLPHIAFSLLAERMALSDVSAKEPGICTSSAVQGDPPCTFHAYLIAQKPSTAGPSTDWFLSLSDVTGEAQASAVCGTCGRAEVTPSAAFDRGVATFKLALTEFSNINGQACQCNVTVEPPDGLGSLGQNISAQSFSVSYAPTNLFQWRWRSSKFLAVLNTRLDTGVIVTTSRSVVDRLVELTLEATDFFDRHPVPAHITTINWADRPRQISFLESLLSPPGCFVCAHRNNSLPNTCLVTVNPAGNVIRIEGTFRDASVCLLTTAAVGGLPVHAGADVPPMRSMEVMLDRVDSVEIMRPEVNVSFWGLTAKTSRGERAAVCGHGARLRLRVLDALGSTIKGDHHMEFALSGRRGALSNDPTNPPIPWVFKTGNVSSAELRKRSTGGEVEFKLDNRMTTRVNDSDDFSPHEPWYFKVVVYVPVENKTAYELQAYVVMDSIGPLFLVRRYSHLEVTPVLYGRTPYAPGDDLSLRYEEGRTDVVRWLYGVPFMLRVRALDPFGIVVTHSEDEGHHLRATFTALGIPCMNVDLARSSNGVTSSVYDSCIGPRGSCRYYRTPAEATPCDSSSAWTFGGAENSTAGAEFLLTEGAFLAENVACSNLSRGGGDLKRFTLAASTDSSVSVFMYEIVMQSTRAVRPHGVNITCDETASPVVYVLETPRGTVFHITSFQV